MENKDFNLVQIIGNHSYVRLDEINKMISSGAISVDVEKLDRYKYDCAKWNTEMNNPDEDNESMTGSIITEFLSFVHSKADEYDDGNINSGWALSDLISLGLEFEKLRGLKNKEDKNE